ncbi:hypothetical protein EXIGLDRAFT_252149 [Exidia glandulosa HHB12029]|uniref:Uncharacterized protein n=1 Tax=Exidia glandulosa HHB12029 TaxID=1314781 RepID=A0A165MI74_EXIGL|nr:hypothetical protein EXIGLDRAFT_252149 [Exidia glandulosa HHB12029]
MQLTFALTTLALLLPILEVTAAPRAASTPIPRLQPVKVTPKKAAAAVPVVSPFTDPNLPSFSHSSTIRSRRRMSLRPSPSLPRQPPSLSR